MASGACVMIELLVLSPPSGADAFGWPLGMLVGSAMCLHVNAVLSAIKHARRCWFVPLCVLMFAGIAEGFMDWQQFHDSDFAAIGHVAGSVGLYGTCALKFASVGLMCSAQAAFFPSACQREMFRLSPTMLHSTIKDYTRQCCSTLISHRFVFLIFVEAWPLCFGGLLSLFLHFRHDRASTFATTHRRAGTFISASVPGLYCFPLW
jgi:hypothetical protein